MKSQLILALVGLSFVVGNASPSSAEVKAVHMKIAGYLCGN
ncbi:MAG TPA: hypothetical protein VN937_21515 [Blastocatellia bacterium]|nr:hypothetical protein [Blastocatellia bacterium]